MKIDLNYLNRFNKIEFNKDIELDISQFNKTDIRRLKNLHIIGTVEIDFEDNIVLDLSLNGIMVLPCAITLVDVDYEFSSKINENLGKFDEIYKNNRNGLEISLILWENIVLEIPIRVVSENATMAPLKGEGWKLISEEKE